MGSFPHMLVLPGINKTMEQFRVEILKRNKEKPKLKRNNHNLGIHSK